MSVHKKIYIPDVDLEHTHLTLLSAPKIGHEKTGCAKFIFQKEKYIDNDNLS